jgi:molybdopterin-containing oxidoreductase family iron-sulfur binding subunit
MSQKKYWQGFGESNDPEKLQKQVQDEFRDELPFADLSEDIIDTKAPRRDFLKYLGFSTAAAALAAGCKVPERKIIPFANKPEDIIPGEAKYYATTFVQDGDVVPVLAKVRDGRPIKIEGNDLCGFTKGGTTARAQASVLDLYDNHRLRFPQRKINNTFQEVPTYEALDTAVSAAMAGIGAGKIVLLTTSITSPTTKKIISEFFAKFPTGRHIQNDAISYSGMLLANEASGFGRKLPSYNFDAAKVIVSLGADFLGTWLAPLEFATGYTKGRKINEAHPEMSKHYQFEGHLSNTGAVADERFSHRPSETGLVALALLNALTGGTAVSVGDAKLQAGIKKAADDLNAHNGAGLVVCGSNDVNTQVIVNAINSAIGAYGRTIDWGKTLNYRQGIDKDLADLITEMEAGSVGALLIYGANPSYSWYDNKGFDKALAKVKTKIAFSDKMDETTQLCDFIVPTPHYLESWGDAEPKQGFTSFLQPTINPLFKTRPFQTSLLKWSGNNTDYDTYFRNHWIALLGTEENFEKTLQAGIYEPGGSTSMVVATPHIDSVTHHTADSAHQETPQTPVATGVAGSYNGTGVDAARAAITAAPKVTGDEVILYEKVSIGSGVGSTNPWLQELPDAISKATWDNYAMISMAKAYKMGFLSEDKESRRNMNYEYYPQKPVIELKVPGQVDPIELPIIVIPGMNPDTIAVALGYGRSEKLGRTAAGVGKKAYPFATFNGSAVGYSNAVTVTDKEYKVKVARMQIHNSYEGRKEVVRETTMGAYRSNPNKILNERKHLEEAYSKGTNNFRANGTLYPDPDSRADGPKWGMAIDMNACYGCGACVVACNAENNVPVVGKNEVARYHDMHWLRIDRYFVTDDKNPDDLKGVVFQPMLCQHCDNAPCENVCPVSATNHSAEGINQMAYNRCIGTRYCANNCPYKVRRFNWADYTGADSFPDNQDQELVGKLDPVVHQMNDELTRMVLNPDVTVRSRGVMEKCTFCVQRTQLAKLQAKKENRPLKDGEPKTACQQACSGDAIVFGNVHDSTSQVSQIRKDNPQRSFYVLEQLHVLPNITYLAKVRNVEEGAEAAAAGGHEGEHH